MGLPTGFLIYPRVRERCKPVEERLRNYEEFIFRLGDAEASQQGARCMDCGIPFCHNACPVNNVIPDWNDLVFRQHWREAVDALHATNNFPEFTGRICPAPCEAACTLNINAESVGIKSIERFIIDKAWELGWVKSEPAVVRSGKTVAVVGSGPAGLAAAQQLARAGHTVTVFEKNSCIGGLLRYGIPDFKLDKQLLDRRIAQMEAEGVSFRTCILVGVDEMPVGVVCDAVEMMSAATLFDAFDAVILACGAEVPRDLEMPERTLEGVYFALEFLISQNKAVAGGEDSPISAKNKHVVVIGGGDTGADCVGTANRQGATQVTQLELMPMPPEKEDKALSWPYWPLKLRTSSSHEEGCRREFAVATKAFIGRNGKVERLKAVRVKWANGQMEEVPGSEFEIKADLVLLAMGFVEPVTAVFEAFGVVQKQRKIVSDNRIEVLKTLYKTNRDKVFIAGDMRRGQSLVVWAIQEGRQCAEVVDLFFKE